MLGMSPLPSAPLGLQVIVCGDLNVAASQQDVHQGLDYSRMYSLEEKRLLEGLLHSLADTWRRQHPDTSNCFTVWDEYTNARVFNRVRSAPTLLLCISARSSLQPLHLPSSCCGLAPSQRQLVDGSAGVAAVACCRAR